MTKCIVYETTRIVCDDLLTNTPGPLSLGTGSTVPVRPAAPVTPVTPAVLPPMTFTPGSGEGLGTAMTVLPPALAALPPVLMLVLAALPPVFVADPPVFAVLAPALAEFAPVPLAPTPTFVAVVLLKPSGGVVKLPVCSGVGVAEPAPRVTEAMQLSTRRAMSKTVLRPMHAKPAVLLQPAGCSAYTLLTASQIQQVCTIMAHRQSVAAYISTGCEAHTDSSPVAPPGCWTSAGVVSRGTSSRLVTLRPVRTYTCTTQCQSMLMHTSNCQGGSQRALKWPSGMCSILAHTMRKLHAAHTVVSTAYARQHRCNSWLHHAQLAATA